MAYRRATRTQQVAYARRSLGRWTGALVAVTAGTRSLTGLITFFDVGPLTGVGSQALWALFGPGPVIAEWLLSGLLVIAGIIIAARVKSIRTHRRAQTAGWFIVVDTILYVASIAVVLVAETDSVEDPFWKFLAVLMIANAAPTAIAVVVIRKARSIPRMQHDLRWHYIRKSRLAETDGGLVGVQVVTPRRSPDAVEDFPGLIGASRPSNTDSSEPRLM